MYHIYYFYDGQKTFVSKKTKKKKEEEPEEVDKEVEEDRPYIDIPRPSGLILTI